MYSKRRQAAELQSLRGIDSTERPRATGKCSIDMIIHSRQGHREEPPQGRTKRNPGDIKERLWWNKHGASMNNELSRFADVQSKICVCVYLSVCVFFSLSFPLTVYAYVSLYLFLCRCINRSICLNLCICLSIRPRLTVS